MNHQAIRSTAMAGGLVTLILLSGCAQPKAADTTSTVTGTPTSSVAQDNRIPPERRAQLERTIAQQQAGAAQMSERMQAAAKTRH